MKCIQNIFLASFLSFSPLNSALEIIPAQNIHKEILKESNYLTRNILEELQNKEFSYREKDTNSLYNYPENKEQVFEISQIQNQIICHMLESLKNKEFKRKIGRIIKKDVEDKYSEYGGIIEIKDNKKIILKEIQSELRQYHDTRFNNFYLIPKEIDSLNHLAQFHLHAETYNESKFSGPSPLDIITQESKSCSKENIHEFVITSLEKGKFNIDYYGTTKKKKKSTIIDLGNYEY